MFQKLQDQIHQTAIFIWFWAQVWKSSQS